MSQAILKLTHLHHFVVLLYLMILFLRILELIVSIYWYVMYIVIESMNFYFIVGGGGSWPFVGVRHQQIKFNFSYNESIDY